MGSKAEFGVPHDNGGMCPSVRWRVRCGGSVLMQGKGLTGKRI